MKNVVFLSALLFLSACVATHEDQAPSPEGNVGAACSTDTDCQTPMDYLIRSSCPFTSLCVHKRCAVVCPMSFHDPDPSVSNSQPAACERNEDCDCGGYAGSDAGRCACVSNACFAIMEE